MPVSPARAAAFDILLRIEQQDAYATELLHARQYASLSYPDRALSTELVMGVLRWRSLLDERISMASSQELAKLDIEVLVALRLAAHQLLFLSRIPARASINESVELVKRARKRSAVPFANAVLRKLATLEAGTMGKPNASEEPYKAALAAIAASKTSASLAQLSAHPLWLVERWVHEFGLETARLICLHNQSVPATAIRLRALRDLSVPDLSVPDLPEEDELRNEGVHVEPGSLLSSARKVLSSDVTKTHAFAEGRVAIQDEASQLVAHLVGHGSRVLDCCGAPGGKTAILADRNPAATIIAADLHPHRARLLRKLVASRNVHVLTADTRKLPFAFPFDRVLVDVPCSGTGTLTRNPEIKWRLSPEDLADLHSRQLDILRSAMSHVAPGGRLVYSTCSLEPEENSLVVEKALATEPSFHLLDCREELQRLKNEGELVADDFDALLSGEYLRTIPGVLPVDGFFAAILEKS